MRVYLDTSVLNRPFDDQSQVKIFLETQAFLLILTLIESQQIALVSSSVLEYENSRNSRLERANAVNLWLSLSKTYQKLTPEIRLRAKALEKMGVKPLDALHIASAEASRSDYFLSCDKRLINRCQALDLKVMNPTYFITEVDYEG
ncbi:PIN domain-containing protein [Coleofasciculus sp.]|uniref:PIN domain-containing protein n=1 Tax=Coleofasciculus sp. TaxID=3100458 RepID=UPI003A442796